MRFMNCQNLANLRSTAMRVVFLPKLSGSRFREGALRPQLVRMLSAIESVIWILRHFSPGQQVQAKLRWMEPQSMS